MARYKLPESVLVAIYTPEFDVLLLERADFPGFWQSVTGSRASATEPLAATCSREVHEETGLLRPAGDFEDWNYCHSYPIYPQWRHRYAPEVTHNVEHLYGLPVAERYAPRLAPREHRRWQWLGWRQAADVCFSWTNAQAIRLLARRAAADGGAGAAGRGSS